MRFETLVLKNVARRPIRSVLTIGGLSTAVAAVVAFVGVANGFGRSFNDVYQAHGIDLVVSRKGADDHFAGSMDESAAQRIQQIDGVRVADGFLLDAMSLESEGTFGLPAVGVRPESPLVQSYAIIEGKALQSAAPRTLLLGSQLAARLKRGVGEKVTFYEDESFEIVGIFESRSTWENGSMVIPLTELQRLSDRKSQVTFVNVILKDRPTPAEAQRIIAEIEALDSRLSAMATEDFVESDARIRVAGAMAWMTSTIALVIGAIGMLNTMMASVFERTHEIGILRAIGWRKSRIVRLILLESVLLSLAAAVFGSLLGVGITWGLSRLPVVSGTISPHIDWRVLAQGSFIAVFIGFLGALYPALRGARLTPTSALRHE